MTFSYTTLEKRIKIIHNGIMRNTFLIFTVLILMTAPCLSAPNYDPNQKPVVYDVSYNVALRKKLEDDYHKKYTKVINENFAIDTAPLNAYYWEVQVPYDLQKKRWQDTIIKK